jgi:hypothetical protein
MSPQDAVKLRVNLLRLAGLAVILGLVMEAFAVIGGAPASLLSLLDHGLWPFMVCAAVGIGQALVGLWPPRAGAFSLVATPIAFLLAKVIQKGMAVLTEGAQPGALIESNLWLEAGLRALEYAVLAAALAWLVRQPWAGALAHIAIGLVIGLLFGALIAAFLPPDSLLGWVAEEAVFPAGCSLIVFVSETLVHLLPQSS